jgi:hypothetical protein
MIGDIQKRKILRSLLKPFYLKGRIPKYSEILQQLSAKFAYKKFGAPFFSPKGAAMGTIVDPVKMTDNISEIKSDLEVSFEDLSNLVNTQVMALSSAYGRFEGMTNRLNSLNSMMSSLILKESMAAQAVLFDNFKDTSKVNLSTTTAFVDTTNNDVTLAINPGSVVTYPPSAISLVSESYPSGGSGIGSPFLNVFTSLIDQDWKASLPSSGTYQAVVNLTSGPIIAGTSNEVDVNSITVQPMTPINLRVESSNDNLNWNVLISEVISSSKSYNITASPIKFLRFSISPAGSSVVGIKSVTIGNTGILSNGSLYSNALTSPSPISTMTFSSVQSLPLGTQISHMYSTGPNGPWSPLGNSPVTIGQNLSVGVTCSPFTPDSSALSSLWSFPVSNGAAILANSAALQRGIGQVRVDTFHFNYDNYADANHIPILEDWNGNVGVIQSCYMSPVASTSQVTVPAVVASGQSFIFNYVNSAQEWWGVALHDTSMGFIASNNYTYKLTSYLYSDRNATFSNFSGGVYVSPFTPPNGNVGWGWTLYVNGNRMASDNRMYAVAIPGSGTILANQGMTFPISIVAGWNKFEILIYVPSVAALPSNISGYEAYLLFRPNIFGITMSDNSYNYSPALQTYPLWADGEYMKQVTEFYLQWNTAPMNSSYWAWRLDPSSGTPSYALLNYNPAATGGTIDGRFFGSPQNLLLTYSESVSPVTSIYYRADLSSLNYGSGPPKLYSYEFQVQT